jgi:hypothetical protein
MLARDKHITAHNRMFIDESDVALYLFADLLHRWRQPGRFLHSGIPPMRAGPSIERCGAELLSALLLGGKTQKTKHFAIY